MGKNRKTTFAGIAAILAGAAGLATGIASGDWSHAEASMASIVTGIGLICAKDHNVTGGSVQQ